MGILHADEVLSKMDDPEREWGDEIPVLGEVDPLEHLAPELEAAVLDTARALFDIGQDATMVARRIHAALDGAVEAVTRPESQMAWKGTKFERNRLANRGPGGRNGGKREPRRELARDDEWIDWAERPDCMP